MSWLEAANEPDPDRWCWPNDPSPDAAMNGAEIEMLQRRVDHFQRQRIGADVSEMLADRLTQRDREGDDWRACAECRHGNARRCADGAPLPIGMLHRCDRFRAV